MAPGADRLSYAWWGENVNSSHQKLVVNNLFKKLDLSKLPSLPLLQKGSLPKCSCIYYLQQAVDKLPTIRWSGYRFRLETIVFSEDDVEADPSSSTKIF